MKWRRAMAQSNVNYNHHSHATLLVEQLVNGKRDV